MGRTRPNIILITTDQQRGDCMGYENPAIDTPNLNEMAAAGARCTRAYSAVPSCTPGRAALLTGMNQWNHGRLTMKGSHAMEYPATLPGELARAGYHTQAVGKMHFSPMRRRYGFHNLILDETSAAFMSDYRMWFERNRQGYYDWMDHSVDWNSWMGRPSHLPEHLHPTHWTVSQGIEFLKRRDPTSPFFLWLSFTRPHSPYDPPQPYYDMYINNTDVPKPVVGEWAKQFDAPVESTTAARGRVNERETHRARAAYYGSVTFIDHQIGRFLYEYRVLDRAALANTFFLFTSDHGDMLGDHHHWRKTYAYEGSARVPFLMKYPSSWDVPQGEVIDRPIELQDVMPTLLDAAGVDIPESVDGQSVLELAKGRTAGWREYVQGEHTVCYGPEWGMQYVTDGREKYIWFHHTDKHQLFDLVNDPMECRDLSDDPGMKARIELWRGRLAAINEERGDPRGRNGQLVPQPSGALELSPNYFKWKERAEAMVP